MSFSKRDIILRAFRAIGLASFVFDLTPEELQDALTELEQMLASWATRDILLPYHFGDAPDADLDDDSGLATGDVLPVVQNLGLSLAGMFGKTPTPMQVASANQSYAALLTAAALRVDTTRPQRPGVPSGAGNKAVFDQAFLPTTDTAELQQRSDSGELRLGE